MKSTRSKPILNLFTLFALLAALLGSAVIVTPAYAAGIVVNSNADTLADDGTCTLREAITNANGDSQLYATAGECAAGSGTDTIAFAADYTITLVGSQLPVVTTAITITGNGAANTIIQANAAPNTATYRVFEVSATGDLTLDGLTVRNGRCDGSCPTSGNRGGGIHNAGALTASNVTFSGNSTTINGGGGLFNNTSSATLTDVTFSANSAGSGGGMYNLQSNPALTNVIFSSNSAPSGGGMYNNESNPTLTNVTFSANSATSNRGGGMTNINSSPTLTDVTFSANTAAVYGGGMYNSGSSSSPTLTNVTFSGNTSAGYGGGMYNSSSPTLTNVTFSANSAVYGGGMYNIGSNSTTTLTNTLIANSANGGDCVNSSSTLNAASSNNLVEDSANACGLTDGTNGNIVGQDPNLGALADNGGSTQTFALLAGSPAIDAGTNAGCPATDQRGVTRPQGAGCDIGAYEVEPTQPGPDFVVNTAADSNDGFCDLLGQGIGNQDCTLREAMNAANAVSGTDSITFAADYTITLLSSQLPTVTTPVTITGNGTANTILQANAAPDTATYRVFEVANTGNLTLDSLTVRNGRCNGSCATSGNRGGGIYNAGALTASDVTFSANTANLGGGLYNYTGSSTTLMNVTFSSNSAISGGGMLNYQSSPTLTNVTFSGNSATGGGGMFNESSSSPTLTNVTFSANTASTYGGGMLNGNSSNPTLTNVTFSGNSATTSGGGMFNNGSPTLTNTLIANSASGGDCVNSSSTLNAASSNNLIEGSACGLTDGVNGNIIGQDPNLGALADNGGTTQTFALLAGSPAIDTGTNTGCPATDQRGMARPQGAGCDIGAYEVEPTQPGPDFVVNTSADTDDGFCDLLGQGTGNQDCTLREAMNAANAVSDTDSITFAADYTITLVGSQLPVITTPIIINGNGAANTILQADAAANIATYRVFEVANTGNLTLDSLTVRNGRCNGSCPTIGNRGGGIYNAGALTASSVTFSANSVSSGTSFGGGIYNHNNSNATLTNVTFSANSAYGGGGMFNNNGSNPTLMNVTFSANTASGSGGGIYNYLSSPTLTNVTFSGNSAGWGGGMENLQSNPALTNVTFSGNSATNYGGGMYNNNGSPTLTNVTFSGNSATSGGGGIYNYSSSPTLTNTLIANSASGGDCKNSSSTLNASSSNNLIEDSANACDLTDSTNGNIIGQDPNLDALADNGGTTQTFALLAGSPAFEAGTNTGCSATDQRGVARPQGLLCDIGAYEIVEPTQPGPDFVVNTSADTDDDFCDLLGQGTGNQDCTLREAMNAANAVSDTDIITFAADYTITLVGSQLPAVITPITITGNGATNTIIQANAASNTATYRVFEVSGTGDLTLESLTVRNGRCNGSCATFPTYGGGIFNAGALTVSDVIISGNSSASNAGGGMINYQSSATLTNVTFSANSANTGGGMFNYQSSATLTNVTFSANTANYAGGGMYNNGSNPTLTNVTFSANTGSSFGGGIYNHQSNPTLTNVTFSANSANFGGGMFNYQSSPTLTNTLIANSANGGDCRQVSSTLNAASSNNLIEEGDTCDLTNGENGNVIGQDPNLGALADNGGTTETFALLAGSPANNAGTNTGCPATDQRGATRPQGLLCDIGAYEIEESTQPGPDFVVNTSADTDDGDCDLLGQGTGNQDCTLREAMTAANSTNNASEITFAADYTITLVGSQLPAVNTAITINGNGAANTIIQADAAPDTATYRVFEVDGAGNLSLDGLTVRNGRCDGSCPAHGYVGGGIYNAGALTVSDVTFSANSAISGGGGVGNYNSATLTNVTFSANSTGNSGGGMFNFQSSPTMTNVTFSGNSASSGGGMFNESSIPTLTDVTFSANSATSNGGGMFNNSSSATLTNVTFSGNTAAGYGGGMFNESSNPTLTNVTFSANSAFIAGGMFNNSSNATLTNVTFNANSAQDGGGIYNNFSSPTLTNTLIANSTSGGDCVNVSSTLNAASSNNLIEDSASACDLTNGMNGNIIGQDPSLGALADNGGTTQTHALLAGSPAIDAGDDTNCPVTDQRGVARPQGDHCDIGSYEAEDDTTAPTVTSIVRASADHTSAASVGFTVTFSEPVLNVDANDFTLNVTGSITGASIGSITGSGSTRTVTVNTGSGNGTLQLSVPVSATITDLASNPMTGLPFTSGETYSILKTTIFSDVSTGYWAWQYVERLYNAGITGGCNVNPLQYCPEGTVTRAQMAIFLLRGIHGSSYTPPAVGGSTGFGDVPTDYWAAAWIKQLAAEGITGGCGSGNYCPEASVTRAQMAIFLLRSKYGASYAPPAVGGSTGFTDVEPTYWAAAWIKQLVAEGITAGCGAGTYCPEAPVTRAQMAVFLVRTFNLP